MDTITPTTMSPMAERLVSRLEARGDELSMRLQPVGEGHGWNRALHRAETGGTRVDRAREALLARLDERQGGESLYERYAHAMGGHATRPMLHTAQWSGDALSWLQISEEGDDVFDEEEELQLAPLSERHTPTRIRRNTGLRARTPLARARTRGTGQVRTAALERVRAIAETTRGPRAQRLRRAVSQLAAAPPEVQSSEAVRLLDRMRGTEAAVARTWEEPVAAPTPVSRVMTRADQASGRIEARRRSARREPRNARPELLTPTVAEPEVEEIAEGTAARPRRKAVATPSRTTTTARREHTPARVARSAQRDPVTKQPSVRARRSHPELGTPEPSVPRVGEGVRPSTAAEEPAVAQDPPAAMPAAPRPSARAEVTVEPAVVAAVARRGVPAGEVEEPLPVPLDPRPQRPEGPLARATRREEGRALNAERRRVSVEEAWQATDSGLSRSLLPSVMRRSEAPRLGEPQTRRLAGVGEPTWIQPTVGVEAEEEVVEATTRRRRRQAAHTERAEPRTEPQRALAARETGRPVRAETREHTAARSVTTSKREHAPASVAAARPAAPAVEGAAVERRGLRSTRPSDGRPDLTAPRLSPTARAWQRASVLPAVAAAIEARAAEASGSRVRRSRAIAPEQTQLEPPTPPGEMGLGEEAAAPASRAPRSRGKSRRAKRSTGPLKRAAARQLSVPQTDGLGAPRALPSPVAYVALEEQAPENPRLAPRRRRADRPSSEISTDAAAQSSAGSEAASETASHPATRAWSRWIEAATPQGETASRAVTSAAVVEAGRTSRLVHGLETVLMEPASADAPDEEDSLGSVASAGRSRRGRRTSTPRTATPRRGETSRAQGVALRSRRRGERLAEADEAPRSRVLGIAGRADPESAASEAVRWRRAGLPSLPALQVLRAAGISVVDLADLAPEEIAAALASPRSRAARSTSKRISKSPGTATVASALVRAGMRWTPSTAAEARRFARTRPSPDTVLPRAMPTTTEHMNAEAVGPSPAPPRRRAVATSSAPPARSRPERQGRRRSVARAAARAERMPAATRTVGLAYASLDAEGRQAAELVTRELRPLERIAGASLESMRARPVRTPTDPTALRGNTARSAELAYLEPEGLDEPELPWEDSAAALGGGPRVAREARKLAARWRGQAPAAERWVMATEGSEPAVARGADGRYRSVAEGTVIDSASKLERAIARRSGGSSRRASGGMQERPAKAREGLMRALTRASKPMDLAAVLLDRPTDARGLADDLQGPAAQVVREIVKMRTLPAEARELLSGPEQRRQESSSGSGRRSRKRGGFTRASARRVLGMAGGGPSTTSSTDGKGSTRLMKLSQKLMGLIHLAEAERQQAEAARRVRRSDEKVDAPAPADGGAESGPDGVTLSALQREVLEAVLRELEQVKDRREGGSDVDLWW